ncbi:unnamed protein product [Urochloa humidicola]
MVMGSELPLPDSLVLCFMVMAIDWVLAIVTFGTACAAVSVVQISAQWHVFVHYVAVPYIVYSALALFSGLMACLLCLRDLARSGAQVGALGIAALLEDAAGISMSTDSS